MSLKNTRGSLTRSTRPSAFIDPENQRMAASFHIDVDPARDLVRIRLGGFFEPAHVKAFVEARDFAYKRLRCGRNAHVTMVDMREMQIQPQQSVAAFQQMIADPATASRRLAFVLSRTLARMQIQRAAADRTAAYFDSEEEAERWLFADDDRCAMSPH